MMRAGRPTAALAAAAQRQTPRTAAAMQQVLARGLATYNGEQVFDKILIANRGEIACRVIKTARKMGIKTVAIYSEPDKNAMHVKMADEAYLVGPAASSQSYLNIDRIMEVIAESGAQAVHPGYGFLSENHLFAEALEAKNVAFIGPGAFAITAMGDKIESKQLAINAGVNTVPGSLAVVKTDEQIKQIANEIGYPVMIKASAGGGGKGMRIAWNDAEAIEGFRLSTEEARSSFGDDRIFIEKFVEEPRHIEIQLIADTFGNVAALPERECSIQRRNQKVLEESPSTFLDPETRKAMQAQAIQLAKAVDYRSAGTVEFLCDKNRNFYFLEMNTRLQVEHPVSELVSGIDLVEQMIRVAAGHKLPEDIMKEDRPILGWAHEARVYAEDPFRGFLPSTGRLVDYQQPTEEQVPGVRVDTGVSQGSEISMFYDPMICKLITHADTREEALDRLELALDNYVVKGLGHNINFLIDVCRHPKFKSGAITTKFIEEEYPEGFSGVKLTSDESKSLAAVAAMIQYTRNNQTTNMLDALRPSVQPTSFVVSIDEDAFKVTFAGDTGETVLSDPTSGEEIARFNIRDFQYKSGEILVRALIDDAPQVIQCLDRLPQGFRLQYCGAIKDILVHSELEYEMSKYMLPKPEIDMAKWLLSPMPGSLISVAVTEGQEVFAGQELAVVEAMKMQNVLRAERNGVVKKVYANAGETLSVDQEIVEFE
ncbi:Propionyl-CoA carboxylase alpha chain, mitochondrial [Hondaea fermentalgiana]|uniref:propionyl-CoA carboxylase n=1 Tax=Hondaea fermentalgiana TaxID=2315210 RepID=A0A2R5GEI4_9STRA|nr:Propionyl-CoA carboxylase alpha chain, mitochondrial [Hondaea fermentalgiana]|eukprot:GBG28719.1 Propionyl-CoA carboxylase alpha chain, mitochondrial [Hondaea fermentalgiana]